MTNVTTETAVSSPKPSLLLRLVPYGALGGLVNVITFYPLLLVCFAVAIELSNARDYNSNADAFMGGLFCWPPALITSVGLGMGGALLGFRLSGKSVNGRSLLAFLLAVMGGLLGPALFLLPATIIILQEWANY